MNNPNIKTGFYILSNQLTKQRRIRCESQILNSTLSANHTISQHDIWNVSTGTIMTTVGTLVDHDHKEVIIITKVAVDLGIIWVQISRATGQNLIIGTLLTIPI